MQICWAAYLVLANDLQRAMFNQVQTNLTATGQQQLGISMDNGREEQLAVTESTALKKP